MKLGPHRDALEAFLGEKATDEIRNRARLRLDEDVSESHGSIIVVPWGGG